MLICCLQAIKMCCLRITWSKDRLDQKKTKMKVSGQYDNLNRASDHDIIRSYIETGKRYGWNIFELCTRALEDHYVKIEDMQ